MADDSTRNASAGRFAPSPTSDLHLGNLRTGLLAWLFARSTGRRFWLRIEDLDRQRVAAAPDVENRQLADLAAWGIDWDAAPVRQSDRTELYRRAAATLDTYECFCSRRDVARASQAPHGGPETPGGYRPYPGTCATLTAAQRAERRLQRKPAIRVRAEGARFSVHDRHVGEVEGPVDDFVLFRGDGTPSYNLAVVVDDGEQGVDQVVRGNDLLGASPSHGWLAAQLGHRVPSYVHVGLALNSEGDRLAKRDRAVTLADLAVLSVSAAEALHWACASAGLPMGDSATEILDQLDDGQLDNRLVWRQCIFDPPPPTADRGC